MRKTNGNLISIFLCSSNIECTVQSERSLIIDFDSFEMLGNAFKPTWNIRVYFCLAHFEDQSAQLNVCIPHLVTHPDSNG